MTPERIADALGGRRSGRGFSARCPLHGDRHASLSIHIDAKGALRARCFAGCPEGDLVAHLRQRGLWCERIDPVKAAVDAATYERQRREEAHTLWRESVEIAGTPGADYLRRVRHIRIDPGRRLRWHWRKFAILALVTDATTDQPVGVQLTPLDRYTHRRTGGITCYIGDKRRPETWKILRRPDQERRFVGKTGVVRLIEGTGYLLIGEGIETTLSAAQMVPYADGAWCALSAGGIARLRLPYAFGNVGLLVDRDAAGEAACRKGAEAVLKARPARRIRLLRPPTGYADFNDALRAMGGSA